MATANEILNSGVTVLFEDTASYTRKQYPYGSSQSSDITGIFANEFVEVNEVISSMPTFATKITTVPNIAKGDWIVISSTVYKVMDYESDGIVLIKLILEKQ